MEWQSRKQSANVDDRRGNINDGEGFLSEWINNGYRRNEKVKKVILSKIDDLKEGIKGEKSDIHKLTQQLLNEPFIIDPKEKGEESKVNLLNELKKADEKFEEFDLMGRNKPSSEVKSSLQKKHELLLDELFKSIIIKNSNIKD